MPERGRVAETPCSGKCRTCVDLVSMHIFARVVEAKSFSAAARRLHVSKSVVSKHVTRLEQCMGVQLVTRTTHSLSLTEIGRQFYARCAEMLAAAEEAEVLAARFQSSPRGTLRLSSPVAFGMACLAPALPRLLSSSPDLRIEMTLTNRAVNIVEDAYDIAIVIGDTLPPGLVARRIASVQWRICAAPSYLQQRGTPRTPAELAGHNCLIFTESRPDNGKKWRLGGAAATQIAEVNGNLHVNNLAAIRQAALHDGGIAVLPTYLVAEDISRGDLIVLLVDDSPADTAIHAVFARTLNLSPKVRVFVDFLIEHFAAGGHCDHAAQSAVHQVV